MATNKDLRNWYYSADHCEIGYTCEYNAPRGKDSLLKLGYNSGVYGWNWTAYLDTAENKLYISCYRNVPADITEK